MSERGEPMDDEDTERGVFMMYDQSGQPALRPDSLHGGRFPVKSQTNSAVLGVAGGLAEHFGVSPTLVRLGFVLLSFVFMIGLLAYIALAFLMPWPGDVPRSSRIAFAVAVAPIVALGLLSTMGALTNGEAAGFSLYFLWLIAAVAWTVSCLAAAVSFLVSRLDIFTGVVSAIGLGMVTLVVTGIADLGTALLI